MFCSTEHILLVRHMACTVHLLVTFPCTVLTIAMNSTNVNIDALMLDATITELRVNKYMSYIHQHITHIFL